MLTTDTTIARSQGAFDAAAQVVLFFVHSNLLISTAATSVALSTMLLADLPVEWLPLFIVFAVTLFVYSFNRLTDLAEDEENVPRRASFIDDYGFALLAVGTVLYFLATVAAIVAGIRGAPAMVVPLAVALLYSVFGLKRVLLVKNLLVGLSWGLIPLGVGVYYEVLVTFDVLFMFAFTTASLTIAAVVFDIKDIEGDRVEGIRTVPVLAGPRRTRQLASVATTLLGVGVAGLIAVGALHARYAALLVFLAYILGYSQFATTDRTPLFYGFVIDSEHILLAAILLATEALL
ncbi:MAG: UbiA family prenyltransferase [Natrialbaceae archaeon]